MSNPKKHDSGAPGGATRPAGDTPSIDAIALFGPSATHFSEGRRSFPANSRLHRTFHSAKQPMSG
jgi:hypothetical protein